MRRWMTILPVAGAYTLSAAAFSRIPLSARPDFSPLLPWTLPEVGPVSRIAAALLIPSVALGVWALLSALSAVPGAQRPLPEWWLNEKTGSESVKRFEPTFATIVFAVTALVALVHVALIGSLLGWPAVSYRILTVLLGLGMIAAGNVMPRTRPNWIVGVRTKRTLSDPAVWLRTHRLLGAFLMAAGGVVVLTSIVAGTYALVVALVTLLAACLAAYVLGGRTSGKASVRATRV